MMSTSFKFLLRPTYTGAFKNSEKQQNRVASGGVSAMRSNFQRRRKTDCPNLILCFFGALSQKPSFSISLLQLRSQSTLFRGRRIKKRTMIVKHKLGRIARGPKPNTKDAFEATSAYQRKSPRSHATGVAAHGTRHIRTRGPEPLSLPHTFQHTHTHTGPEKQRC